MLTRLLLKFIFSLLLLLLFTEGYGQRPGVRPGQVEEEEEDTVQYERVKKPKPPIWPPRAMRVGYDGLNGVRNATNQMRGGQEFTFDIDFARFLLVMDAGTYRNGISGPRMPLDSINSQFRLDSIGNNLGYSIEGTYYRFGIAGNVLPRDKEGSTFTFSLKRGFADFTDSLRVGFGRTGPENEFLLETANYTNQKMHVQWYEFNMGMKTRIWKQFWLGYEAGLKFRIRYNTTNLVPFFVPGYGKAENVTASNSTWGFNYHLIYYIPFKRAKRELGEIGK